MKKRKVLLGMPESYGMAKVIEGQLKSLDYEVYNISFKDSAFIYKNLFQKVQNWYQKKIKKNRNYKNYLKYLPYKKKIESIINNGNRFDYALIIRADIYPLDLIQKIKEQTNFFVGYQWDGISRFPLIKQYIPLFDKFYVFDKQDSILNKQTILTTNFFIQKDNTLLCHSSRKALFLGGYYKERQSVLMEIRESLKRNHIHCDFFLYSDKKDIVYLNGNGFSIMDKPIDYEMYLSMCSDYDIIIDVNVSLHNGLSFRIFEALGMEKKLITTNIEVLEMDFYNKNNILIWDEESAMDLDIFISKPYKKVEDTVKEKYSFESWIGNIFTSD